LELKSQRQLDLEQTLAIGKENETKQNNDLKLFPKGLGKLVVHV
jgi:hypothetical protein